MPVQDEMEYLPQGLASHPMRVFQPPKRPAGPAVVLRRPDKHGWARAGFALAGADGGGIGVSNGNSS
ncbi:unnamed protein product [Haemonchus placei]|uniref:Uncharacterized protein n=1 Tax=Haemonchus placei TaxID=6290 RepID=A0A0N4W0M9_HAEPC|nr:unnamed protein product [Haemonchus placei]